MVLSQQAQGWILIGCACFVAVLVAKRDLPNGETWAKWKMVNREDSPWLYWFLIGSRAAAAVFLLAWGISLLLKKG